MTKRFDCGPIGWHVISRGARRLDLFRDEEDFSTFLNMLRYSIRASGAIVWAFTLMSNHYHLVLYASSEQLTACMMRLNRSYSRYHNRRYGMVGHSFDGPYKAYRQPLPILLLGTIAYVFLNPVVAGLAKRPQDYPWTCVQDYLVMPGSALTVDPADVLGRVSDDPAEAWRLFHLQMDRESRRPHRNSGDSLTRTQIQARHFDWLLEHARASGDRLAGENPEIVAMYWARQCGVTPKAIATVLTDTQAKTIRQQLWVFGARLKGDPELAKRIGLP